MMISPVKIVMTLSSYKRKLKTPLGKLHKKTKTHNQLTVIIEVVIQLPMKTVLTLEY